MPRVNKHLPIVILAAVLAGAALGTGVFTFYYAQGFSYISNDPAVCANCHIMNEHYDRWSKSSHHAVATCNDCHIPHAFPAKYIAKMENGFHHSSAFTTGNFHEPVRITVKNRRIVEHACRYCHSDVVHAIDVSTNSNEEMSCIRCHAGVGHR